MARFGSTLKHAWNVFTNQEQRQKAAPASVGGTYGTRPDRTSFGL